jgi:hypothetical protein
VLHAACRSARTAAGLSKQDKHPVSTAFCAGFRGEINRPIIGKLMGTHDDGYVLMPHCP